jgi:hypothetical protein
MLLLPLLPCAVLPPLPTARDTRAPAVLPLALLDKLLCRAPRGFLLLVLMDAARPRLLKDLPPLDEVSPSSCKN